MPNSDLLIAQLQRRNRIMFGGMLAGLAVIAIGFGVVMLDATTKLRQRRNRCPNICRANKQSTSPQPASAGSEQAHSQSTADRY